MTKKSAKKQEYKLFYVGVYPNHGPPLFSNNGGFEYDHGGVFFTIARNKEEAVGKIMTQGIWEREHLDQEIHEVGINHVDGFEVKLMPKSDREKFQVDITEKL